MFQEKKQILCHIVIPIHNDNHFCMLDVFLPYDKRPKDQVTIYDYFSSGDKAKKIVLKCGGLIFLGFIIRLTRR